MLWPFLYCFILDPVCSFVCNGLAVEMLPFGSNVFGVY